MQGAGREAAGVQFLGHGLRRSGQRAGARGRARCSVTNPYGRTKLVMEQLIERPVRSPIRRSAPPTCAISIRSARTHPDLIGEDPAGIPNNLMPYICQVAVGGASACRCSAATSRPSTAPACATTSMSWTWRARMPMRIDYLVREDRSLTVNLGTGRGVSVLELLRSFEKASGRDIPYDIVGRRAGRCRRGLCGSGAGQRPARLARGTGCRRDVPRCLALAVDESADGYATVEAAFPSRPANRSARRSRRRRTFAASADVAARNASRPRPAAAHPREMIGARRRARARRAWSMSNDDRGNFDKQEPASTASGANQSSRSSTARTGDLDPRHARLRDPRPCRPRHNDRSVPSAPSRGSGCAPRCRRSRCDGRAGRRARPPARAGSDRPAAAASAAAAGTHASTAHRWRPATAPAPPAARMRAGSRPSCPPRLWPPMMRRRIGQCCRTPPHSLPAGRASAFRDSPSHGSRSARSCCWNRCRAIRAGTPRHRVAASASASGR